MTGAVAMQMESRRGVRSSMHAPEPTLVNYSVPLLLRSHSVLLRQSARGTRYESLIDCATNAPYRRMGDPRRLDRAEAYAEAACCGQQTLLMMSAINSSPEGTLPVTDYSDTD